MSCFERNEMDKTVAEALFGAYFNGKIAVLKYFGAENSAHYDYDLSDDRKFDWAVVDDMLVFDLRNIDEWCEEDPSEGWNYSNHIQGGFFPGEHFSLAMIDLQMGGSGSAAILDNNKRLTPPWE